MATISIIIPCYNGWKYMENCLQSLEKQTILPDEIIVMDDCSTDDSFAQLSAYTATSVLPLRVLRNEKNSGPGFSREVASQLVTSDYVAFCDCDN